MAATKAVSEAPSNTTLAVYRTVLAQERTLMAWVRTTTSMIGFGFTVYKFFQFYRSVNGPQVCAGIFTPRIFAILIIPIGVVSLVLATIDHHRKRRALESYLPEHRSSLAELLAIVVSLFGIVLLVAAIRRD